MRFSVGDRVRIIYPAHSRWIGRVGTIIGIYNNNSYNINIDGYGHITGGDDSNLEPEHLPIELPEENRKCFKAMNWL